MKELYCIDVFLTRHVMSKYHGYNKQILHDTCRLLGIDFTHSFYNLEIMHMSINLRRLASDIEFICNFRTSKLRGFEYVL
jgi:hypothetical protein